MSDLAFSPFNKDSQLAQLSLNAKEFEELLAVNGQSCLWIKNDPIAETEAHTNYGRSFEGKDGDGRITTWPTQTDWQNITANRISTNIYQTQQNLSLCQQTELLLKPNLLRSEKTELKISIQAKIALTEQKNCTITAKENGKIPLENKIDGLRSKFTIKDNNDNNLAYIGVDDNYLYSNNIIQGQTYTINYQEYPAIKLSILSQNLHRNQPWVLDEQGDAMLIFPDWLPITYYDEIVTLSATIIAKHKLIYASDNMLKLPDPYISEIIDIQGHNAETKLINNNTIYWPDSSPNQNQAVVVTYRANPVYRVLGQLPNIRSQENQSHPRKAALKLIARI